MVVSRYDVFVHVAYHGFNVSFSTPKMSLLIVFIGHCRFPCLSLPRPFAVSNLSATLHLVFCLLFHGERRFLPWPHANLPHRCWSTSLRPWMAKFSRKWMEYIRYHCGDWKFYHDSSCSLWLQRFWHPAIAEVVLGQHSFQASATHK